MKNVRFISVIIILFLILSCSHKDIYEDSIESVAITYQAKINVNDEDYIYDKVCYNEILGYDTSNYTFLLNENSANKIKEYFFPSGGLPFTVEVYGEPIYFGKFFPAYSEDTPCGFLIEPYSAGNKLRVRIDYGLCINEGQLIDNRNDKRLITVLVKDDKIIIVDN